MSPGFGGGVHPAGDCPGVVEWAAPGAPVGAVKGEAAAPAAESPGARQGELSVTNRLSARRLALERAISRTHAFTLDYSCAKAPTPSSMYFFQ